jgi:hypothetical protein
LLLSPFIQTGSLLIAPSSPQKSALFTMEAYVNSSQTCPIKAVFLGLYLDGSVSISWLAKEAQTRTSTLSRLICSILFCSFITNGFINRISVQKNHPDLMFVAHAVAITRVPNRAIRDTSVSLRLLRH